MATDVLPYQTPRVPLAKIGGPLPQNPVPEGDDVDLAGIAARAVKALNDLDDESNRATLADDAIWRDLLALTGTYRTFWGLRKVLLAWRERCATERPQGFALVDRSAHVVRMGPTLSWIEASFTFKAERPLDGQQVQKKDCSGIIKIVSDGQGGWKTWIFSTILEGIDGFPDVDKGPALSPDESAKLRASVGVTSGTEYFDAAVIGAGQCGLSAAGRLRAMGVSHVVVDRNSEVGGNWLTRYRSFSLHTSKDSSEMPFGRTFLPEDPYFLTSRHIADGYKRFVDRYGINVWLSSVLKHATWDDAKSEWTLEIEYSGPEHTTGAPEVNGSSPQLRTIRARHLVFCMGGGGQVPKMPTLPNRDQFRGEVLHSVDYTTAEGWRGKHGVIIGTGNTAHDVSEDMVAAGLASVTLIQRNATVVLPLSFYRERFDPLYNAAANIAAVDRAFEAGAPLPVTHKALLPGFRASVAKIPAYFDALEAAGFAVDREIDLLHILYERMGGHYYDVGASKRILDGSVKIRRGALDGFTPTGLRFADGSGVDADVVVFATGFEGNVRLAAKEIVGDEVGDRLEDFWQVDREGEVRGLCKPMVGQRNVWYLGGDTRAARYHSRFLALQIKAELEGQALEVYRRTPGE